MNKPKLTRTRIIIALTVAIIADVLQFPITAASATGIFAIPGEIADAGVDVVTMIVTSLLLGFHRALLPSFILELVPGLDLLPTWTACVAYVIWRRKQEHCLTTSPAKGKNNTITQTPPPYG